MVNTRRVGTLLAPVFIVAMAGGQIPDSQPSQQVFPTTQAAVDTLLKACKDNDSAALVRMLGEQYGEQLKRMDDVEERQHRRTFYNKAREHLKIEEQGDAKAILVIGREHWPVPIPLVKEAAGWRFDTGAGLEELQARRIGENELAVIDVCHEYVRMQTDYAAVDRDGDEVREYAQRFVSTAGKRDGLYWERDAAAHERPSPLEALLPDSFGDVKSCKPGSPHMGYYFRILTRQGANPPGGKYDYIINGNMIAGFALVAWPADYRASGVVTFVISHQGKLFQKDLGPDTAKRVEAMTEYDPDKTWKVARP
ncbi:MAG TPA: DUF2950 domain-containing protein [Phycisphaerae bacterium]|nr:DUF2950 domain-containing protein [Phycisphaerae bacterium]HRY66638.1 DUF2950 domain-containing protein [Phycisphaerae bacterium]HSA27659.1 DUF2950 domain-containing protein [Phycisphaerae bacterium]